MAEHWEARGPDEFGDFTISNKGEQLAKCVVVQNGFRMPQETKAIAEQLIQAVNNHEAMVAELKRLLGLYGHQATADVLAAVVGGSRE